MMHSVSAVEDNDDNYDGRPRINSASTRKGHFPLPQVSPTSPSQKGTQNSALGSSKTETDTSVETLKRAEREADEMVREASAGMSSLSSVSSLSPPPCAPGRSTKLREAKIEAARDIEAFRVEKETHFSFHSSVVSKAIYIECAACYLSNVCFDAH